MLCLVRDHTPCKIFFLNRRPRLIYHFIHKIFFPRSIASDSGYIPKCSSITMSGKVQVPHSHTLTRSSRHYPSHHHNPSSPKSHMSYNSIDGSAFRYPIPPPEDSLEDTPEYGYKNSLPGHHLAKPISGSRSQDTVWEAHEVVHDSLAYSYPDEPYALDRHAKIIVSIPGASALRDSGLQTPPSHLHPYVGPAFSLFLMFTFAELSNHLTVGYDFYISDW